MSDEMTIAVLRSPISPDSGELTLRSYISHAQYAADLIDTLRAEVEGLRSALKIYGRHHAPCQFHFLTNYECTCGFDAALAAGRK